MICTLCDLRFASDRAKLGEVAVPAGFFESAVHGRPSLSASARRWIRS